MLCNIISVYFVIILILKVKNIKILKFDINRFQSFINNYYGQDKF